MPITWNTNEPDGLLFVNEPFFVGYLLSGISCVNNPITFYYRFIVCVVTTFKHLLHKLVFFITISTESSKFSASDNTSKSLD